MWEYLFLEVKDDIILNIKYILLITLKMRNSIEINYQLIGPIYSFQAILTRGDQNWNFFVYYHFI